MLYPLKMIPYFRHGSDTPWGGDTLRALGKAIPDDMTGEALEVSALPGRESVVANGVLAGKTFTQAIEAWGRDLTGCEGEFPLLLKLIDAKDRLSVQVHPDDVYAGEHEGGKLGKTEAWLVLSAAPGTKMVYGVNAKDKAELREMVESGRLEESLNWVSVQPGDVYYIPHGMIHALGAGMVVYEIQQSSDVTYRFWDWGRVGRDGKPRALHTEDALAVSRPELDKTGKLPGATVICEGGSRTAYISDPNFELWRLNVAGNMPLEGGRMRLLTALCPVHVSWAEGEFDLDMGETCVVPAAMPGVTVSGRGAVLCSILPDQAALRDQLGYRAELIAGLRAVPASTCCRGF